MKEEIIIAGFGGQGVLSMGKNPGIFRPDGKQGGDLDASLRSGTARRYGQRHCHCERRAYLIPDSQQV